MEAKDWVKDSREKAPALRASAKAAASAMFATGDLTDFLTILSRLSGYDAGNLLLIQQQYPKATFLASYKVWERLMPDTKTSVLKPEWWGKGIDILVPFTEQRDKDDMRLIWFAVKHFDIAMTNVQQYTLPPSVYVQDIHHMSMLIEAACNVLRTEHKRTVMNTTDSAEPRIAGIPGFLTDKMVYLHPDAKVSDKLGWLVDCLCTLQGGPDPLPPACHDIFFRCIRNALWRTWGLENPPSLYPYKSRIRNMSDDIQMDFLDLLQRSYRSIEESISASYAISRERMDEADSIEEVDASILMNDFRPSPFG